MANTTHTTTFDYKVEGIGEVKKTFKFLADLIPNKELSAAFRSIEKDYVTFLRGLDLGQSFEFLKGDELIKNISSVMEKLQGGMSTAIKSPVLESLKSELAELELKIAEGERKANEAAAKLKKAEEDLKKDLSSGRFNEIKLDESLTTAAKVEAREKQLRKEASKDTTTSNRKKEIEEEIKALEELLPELKKYVKLRRSLGGTLGGATKGVGINEEKLAEANARLAEEQAKLSKAATDASGATDEEREKIEKLNEAISYLSKVMERVAYDKKESAQKKVIKATEDQAKADAELANEEKKLTEVMDKGEKSMAKKLATGLSYYTIFNQIKKVIKSSINSIKELDKAMTKAAIVTSMTRKETWSLLKSYQNLASETGKTTSEIANLNAFFLQQGKNMKQAMEMTEAAAKSAAVAGTTLQDAANYITSAIHGFGLAASAAESVADKFAALGASSASSFEEIAIAMSKVAPVAQSAGVGIDFMMGILAKGIHTTREAPEAIGTAMKTIFARMRELTDIGKATEDGMSLNRVEKAVNSIGVSLRDTTGQFRNLEDVLTDVGMKWKDLNSLEQAYLATALAGTRQQPRLLAILNDFDTTLEMIETSKNAENELMYQHMDYLDSMEAATNQLKNSWEQIVTTIVNADVIITVTQTAADALKVVSNTIGFIADRSYLMIPILSTLTTATVAYTVAKIAEWRSIRKANIQKLIDEKYNVKSTSSLLKNILVRTVGIVTLRAERDALKIASKAKDEDAIKTARSTMLKKLETVATWQLVLASLAWVAAVAAAGVAVYLIVKAIKSANKSLNQFGKEIDNSNKKIYDSSKKTKDLKKLTDEYKKLENQANKTSEELQRMDEILEDLSHFQDGDKELNFIVNGEIDYEKLEAFEREQRDIRAKEQKKALDLAQKSIQKYGIKAFDNSSVKNVFENMGVVFAERALKEMGYASNKSFSNIIKFAIEKEDFSSLYDVSKLSDDQKRLLADNVSDIWRADYVSSHYEAIEDLEKNVERNKHLLQPGSVYEGNKELEKQLEDDLRRIEEHYRVIDNKLAKYLSKSDPLVLIQDRVNKIKESFRASFNVMEGYLEESLSNQIRLYEEALSLLDSDSAKNAFSLEFFDLSKLSKIRTEFDLTFDEVEKFVESFKNRDFSLDFFLDFSTKIGIGEDMKDLTQKVADHAAKKTEYQDILYDLENQVSLKLTKEQIDDLEKRKSILEGYFREEGQIFEKIGYKELTLGDYFQNEGSEFFKKLAFGNFSKDDINEIISDYSENFKREYLYQTEEVQNYAEKVDKMLIPERDKKFLIEEFVDNLAVDEMFKTLSDFIPSFDQIYGKASNIGEVIEKAFSLEDELAKGNRQAFNDLAAELGENGDKILELFLKTKDTSILQDHLAGNLNNMLEDRIAFLNAIVENGGELTDLQEEELKNLKFLQQRHKNLEYVQIAWNKRLEETNNLVERINQTLALTERLSDLELDVPEYFKVFIDESRRIALDKAEKDLEFAFSEIERNKDGDYDDYVQSLENFEEASNIYLDILEKQIDQEKKLREKEIKQIEDSHKDRMDLLKKQHDEKWKAIDYENKILSLQEKVTETRNRLASAMFGGDKAGQIDAAKMLKEAREARQKEIEAQILDRIQKEEEKRKEEEVKALQKKITTYTGEIAGKMQIFLDQYEEANRQAEEDKRQEKQEKEEQTVREKEDNINLKKIADEFKIKQIGHSLTYEAKLG